MRVGIKHSAAVKVIALVFAASVVLMGLQLTVAGPASAKPTGYYQRTCVIKALTGPGIKGNGCNAYGTPRWVSGQSKNTKVNKYVLACLHGGKWALFFLPVTKAGPQALVAGVFAGCVTGVADKLMKV